MKFMLGVALRNVGQLDESAQLFDELLANNPQDLGCLIERGTVAIEARLPEVAEYLLRRAESLCPTTWISRMP